MSNKVVQAMYNEDDVLLHAVKEVREANHHIEEVYTPFPVHGLEKAMGIKDTRIAITAFLYGTVGLLFSIWLMNYTMIQDWPQDIGGKPSFSFLVNMPSFVPVMFEMAVFFAAHLMVITFYMRSKLWPFKKAENPDPRTTDDMFVMEVSVDEDEKELVAFLEKTGTVEIKVTEKH